MSQSNWTSGWLLAVVVPPATVAHLPVWTFTSWYVPSGTLATATATAAVAAAASSAAHVRRPGPGGRGGGCLSHCRGA